MREGSVSKERALHKMYPKKELKTTYQLYLNKYYKALLSFYECSSGPMHPTIYICQIYYKYSVPHYDISLLL